MSGVEIGSERLTLEWFSPQLAVSILDGEFHEDWAEGFPGDGETRAARYATIRDTNDVSNAPFVAYVIRERASGLLIGGTSFHGQPRERAVEIGYGLATSKRGHGYATEACCAMLAAAFASGRVDRVEAETDHDNLASKAVLKRAGFSPLNDVETLWRVERELAR